MITTRFSLPEFLTEQGFAKFDSHITLSRYDVVDGYIRNEQGCLLQTIAWELNTYTRRILKLLEQGGHISEDMAGSFDAWGTLETRGSSKTMPTDILRIVCYAVRGSNEGHYVYVEVVLPNDKRFTLAATKTFGGLDHALLLASIATCLFNGTR